MTPDGLDGSEREKLRASVESILKVYTIPVILKKVLEVVADERASVSDLVEVIQHDQALSSKIVATANTAFYGFRRNISSIPGAAMTLGFNMVRSLAVSVSVFRGSSGDHAFLRELWQHSFETALVTSLIAERTGLVKKEDAFLAGLIHDLGRAILYQIHGEKYLRVAGDASEDGLSEKEAAAFGAAHSLVGAWFVEKYRFPKECVLAIERHHEPEKCDGGKTARDIASMVHLADLLSLKGKEDAIVDDAAEKRLAAIMESVYLGQDGLSEIREKLSEMEEMIKEFYAS
jgi:putative nucleotidyltransferase with HDIG domain